MAEVVQVRAQSRQIGTIIPNVTVEEIGVDEVRVTTSPVEQGAPITDHAYDEPAGLRLRYGWSLSAREANGDASYLIGVYQDLLTLQATHDPFTVVTGKRSYPNMLMTSLSQFTDKDSENSLLVEITCQEVIIVQTVLVTVPPRAVMANPAANAPVEDRGTQQPTDQSLLFNALGGVF